MPLNAVFGGLLGGRLIERCGRKSTLLISNILFIVSWSINYFSKEYWHLYISRSISGCGVGMASLTIPIYLGEIVEPQVRGTLGTLPTVFGKIGILLCFSMGTFMKWRGIAGIGFFLSLPFLFTFGFIPESPCWYMSKNKTKKLEMTHDEKPLNSKNPSNKKSGSFGELYRKPYLKPLLIIVALMLFQQMSGINAVIFYSTQIFEDTGSDIDASIQTIIIGVVNFASTFIATFFVDRLGRKKLLYISSITMILTLGVFRIYFNLKTIPTLDLSLYSWIPLVSLVVYVLGFSFGFGPVPWIMMGEILPAKFRGRAASVATSSNWIFTFLVTATFPLLRAFLGSYRVFGFFGFGCIFGLIFTKMFVSETKGHSLEDIENQLAEDSLTNTNTSD